MTKPLVITITPITRRPATMDKTQFCIIASDGKHRTHQEESLQKIRKYLEEDFKYILSCKLIMEE